MHTVVLDASWVRYSLTLRFYCLSSRICTGHSRLYLAQGNVAIVPCYPWNLRKLPPSPHHLGTLDVFGGTKAHHEWMERIRTPLPRALGHWTEVAKQVLVWIFKRISFREVVGLWWWWWCV